MASSIAKKLGIKKGQRVLIMNAPEGFVEGLSELPEGVTVDTVPDGQYDVVQFFALNKADVDAGTPYVTGALKPGGNLWYAYPKKTSSIKTDIHRDVGWDAVYGAGFDGIALIGLDDTWSSMRFRPVEAVKRSPTSRRPQPIAKPAKAVPKAATKPKAVRPPKDRPRKKV